MILCTCVTDLPSWLLCWLLCRIARTCRTWCDGGSLSLAVHTDTRQHNSRKTFRLLNQVDPLPRYLFRPVSSVFFFQNLCVDLSLQFPRGRALKDAFRTLTVLCTVIVKDKPTDSFSLLGQGSINKDYFSPSCALPVLTLPPPVVESSVMKFS